MTADLSPWWIRVDGKHYVKLFCDFPPCCSAPRLLKLVTNGVKSAKCASCSTEHPR
jgi:uncharacterized protein YhfF